VIDVKRDVRTRGSTILAGEVISLEHEEAEFRLDEGLPVHRIDRLPLATLRVGHLPNAYPAHRMKWENG
jgi:hypothetical protein